MRLDPADGLELYIIFIAKIIVEGFLCVHPRSTDTVHLGNS